MTVFIRGLEFYAYHGYSDEERAIGHRYVLDAEFTVADPLGMEDDLTRSVDYGEAGVFLIEWLTGRQRRTIEALLAELGPILLDRYPQAQGVRLQLAKRLPPAPYVAEAAGVEMVFQRDN